MKTQRVRAIAITDDGLLLTIKRIKPGREPYWVLPGGGVEDTDATFEDALHREIFEELAGTADIHALLAVLDDGRHRQHLYLARIHHYDFEQRTGPEFSDPRLGEYFLHPLPLTPAALAAITLKPPEAADLINGWLAHGTDLFALPDLRSTRP